MRPSQSKKGPFIVAAGLKLGVSLWVILIIGELSFDVIFQKPFLTSDRIAYRMFLLVACFAEGCVAGWLMWREGERKRTR